MNSNNYSLPSNWVDFICTKENLSLVWEKLNQFPILFDDSVRNDYNHFLREMLDPSSIIMFTGDYGIFRCCNIIPYRECDIHLSFWDKRFRGRLEECSQVLKWLFNKLKLHRANIEVPSITYSTINFIKALGFKIEGKRRDSWQVNGRYLDVIEFGILDSDVFELKQLTGEKDGKQTETNDKNIVNASL